MVRECADGMLMCCCGVDLCNCKQCKSSDPCKMSRLAPKVPVGFRFHPTEEELVGYYLPKKVSDRRIDLDLIRELDLYKFEPWDLHQLCMTQGGSNEKQIDYYFFSRKGKKYPTGTRANRATTMGFWKATGRDKPIHTKLNQTLIGMRKTLVFYQGRAPHGIKTDWIMHEFRLDDGSERPTHDGGWVVCRVFKKNKNLMMEMQQERAISYEGQMGALPPEAAGTPNVLPGDDQLTFLEKSSGVKREIISLDDYQLRQSNQYLNQRELGYPSSLNRPDDVNYFMNSYQETSNSGLCEFNDPQTSSGSDGTELNHEETISGSFHDVDWSALLQDPVRPAPVLKASLRCPSMTKLVHDDVTGVLPQLKRQNSDIVSSLDLWNYAQIAQPM